MQAFVADDQIYKDSHADAAAALSPTGRIIMDGRRKTEFFRALCLPNVNQIMLIYSHTSQPSSTHPVYNCDHASH